ncbi:MAG: hypothetical protein OXH98_19090 [Caldilineaceae bacterium]|nr:hypothetical protein [Caldilineaceae bacterium]
MAAERPAIYISDLGRARPGAALSPTPRQNHWQTIPYEAEGVSGTMLVADSECSAPTLVLPLHAQGWHAIHLGVWTDWEGSVVRVKLSGAPCYTPVFTDRPTPTNSEWHSGFATLREAFWIHADLTGRELIVSQVGGRRAGLAYVKLEPLSDADVAAIQEDQARTDTKRLIAYNDAAHLEPRSLEGMRGELEHFRDSDFQKLLWCIGSGSETYFFSDVGEPSVRAEWDFVESFGRPMMAGMRTMQARGLDPLTKVIEFAHDLDLELHGMYLVGGWVYPPNHGFESKFYYQHPEWRCVSRSGRPVTRMSYAFEGVRNFLLVLFREVAERGADGVNLGFVRGLPCLLYEQPMIDGFQQRHGQDPRDLPEDDPRWLRFKAGVMTDFMRALRRELDQVGEQQGRSVQLSAYVLNDEALNMAHGLDAATWAQEGLVDFIIPYPLHNVMDMDIPAYVRMTSGTQCKLYPEVMPRRQSPAEFRQKALDFYAQGVDGLAFWDASSAYRVGFKDEWSMVRRLGHKDELAGWAPDEWPSYRVVPLYSIGGLVMDEHNPYAAA